MVTAVARETVAVEPRPMVGPLVHQPIARKKEGRIRNKVSVLPVGRFKTLVLGEEALDKRGVWYLYGEIDSCWILYFIRCLYSYGFLVS